ncbi:MAG: N-acetylmuramoyl-L-alanine amidase [Blautia sp.]|nr:N-acetylmuramoyl-L-alanine amidase [Blautia sp.]
MKGLNLKILAGLLLAALIPFGSAKAVKADEPTPSKYIVVLDPGHGGYDSGCTYTYSGRTLEEKDINWKIALYCRQALLKEDNIKVYITRRSDTCPDVYDRPDFAASKGADLLVSLHINDAGSQSSSAKGCMVCVSKGGWRPYLAKKEAAFTKFVIKELNALGLSTWTGSTNGMYYRLGDDGVTYPNGAVQDYYGIVAGSVLLDIPGVIIEHGFLSNPSEAASYFSTNAQYKRLGYADARAIVNYFKSSAASVDYGKDEDRDPEWVRIGGKYYYRLSDGSYQPKGFFTINNKIYYIKSDGSRASKFCRIKKKYYYFGVDGAAYIGRKIIDGNYYIFTSKGAMRFGWVRSSYGNYYFTYPLGHEKQGQVLKAGSYVIDGKLYKFGSNGACTNYAKAKVATAKQKRNYENISTGAVTTETAA